MTDLQRAKEFLATGEYTCVLCAGEKIYTATQRGVKPLVHWLRKGDIPRGFSAADKVVGKATAFLYCLLGAQAVYARVMSQSARKALESAGIHAQWDTLTEYIINRKGDGMCPFEAVVLELQQPEEALAAIEAKMKEMGIE